MRFKIYRSVLKYGKRARSLIDMKRNHNIPEEKTWLTKESLWLITLLKLVTGKNKLLGEKKIHFENAN